MRVKGGIVARRRRKKVLNRASGFFGAAHRRFKIAKEQVLHAERYEFIHRRQRKRDFRRLWITRINAAARMNGITYSRLVAGLNGAGFEIDRKILAKLAIEDANAFTKLVELAKANLKN
ncbi:MAG TPA: 50S ribosomal protein L20 [Caldisericia bacterium]|jgi:large subunit ribosomal protein L20|nr:50S ribosomal protein L20 [Caldisericia bacterium]MCE5175940.1 50S ribosomal protein L20 [bacterium]NMD14076.1 50S ribosomal protein L20 [Caldisericales bacterium]OQB70194.1 MAG: 50S ribosomal protein L20 [bacterium ADurb.Bin132]HNW31381.1 50S ribosomal protein L20 [Caldisericia bacterium]